MYNTNKVELYAPPPENEVPSMELTKFSSGAIYRDILPSVDLEYIISGNSVKENIIVKEKGLTIHLHSS